MQSLVTSVNGVGKVQRRPGDALGSSMLPFLTTREYKGRVQTHLTTVFDGTPLPHPIPFLQMTVEVEIEDQELMMGG